MPARSLRRRGRGVLLTPNARGPNLRGWKRRTLPVGIQSLGEIRRMDCYYVDKTAHVLRLTREGKYHFLSRPRRFGKSLLVDTLKELFEGNGELFRGLAIHGQWDWSVKHPVVRISFGGGEFGDPDGVREEVADQLEGDGGGCRRRGRPGEAGDPVPSVGPCPPPAGRPAGGCACGRVRQADPGRACGPRKLPKPTASSCGASTG